MKDIVYLAVPYSHEDSRVMEDRFHKVNAVAAKLINMGYVVFSPISHNHPIKIAHDIPENWEYWKEYDTAFLGRCSKLFVLMLDGWQGSIGVKEEIKIAEQMNIPIEYIT